MSKHKWSINVSRRNVITSHPDLAYQSAIWRNSQAMRNVATKIENLYKSTYLEWFLWIWNCKEIVDVEKIVEQFNLIRLTYQLHISWPNPAHSFTCSILAIIVTILGKCCNNIYKYWANTWKMCFPASVTLASIVSILVDLDAKHRITVEQND